MIKPLQADKAISLTEISRITKLINEEIEHACSRGESSVDVDLGTGFILLDNSEDILEEIEMLYEHAGYDAFAYGLCQIKISW